MLLVEALTALALSALVLGGLLSGTGLLLRVLDRSVRHAQDVELLSRAMAAIDRDLRRATRARRPGPAPQPFVFEGTATALLFAQAGPQLRDDSSVPGERVVAIRSVAGPQGGRILRSEALLLPGSGDLDTLSFGSEQELYAGPLRLRFGYVAPSRPDRPPAAALPRWNAGPGLPETVVAEMIDPESERSLLSAGTRLMVDGDLGCIGGRGGCRGTEGPEGAGPRQEGGRDEAAGGERDRVPGKSR